MSNQPAPLSEFNLACDINCNIDCNIDGNAASPPSPCINVCHIDLVTGLCEGCYRDIDEIIRWSSASDAEKRQLCQQLLQRRNGSIAV